MIDNTKCECGHQNPVGTYLCESCGKPLTQEEGPLEMRYDGVARRSQKANPTLLDRIWRFFSSVKVAIWLIVITLVAASLGTILPQESMFLNFDPSTYYKENYGTFGHIYYLLGLSDTYGSWWFITLLFMIGTSLVVCSLDRVLPLYRALSKQQVRKHLTFITRQKVTVSADLPSGGNAEQWVEQMAAWLRKKRYRVRTDGTALFAEKYRFSRWGPYVLHIGLIIFLLAVLARNIPGWHMDSYVDIREGETVRISGTPYYLKNEKFTVEYYAEDEMDEKFRESGKVVPKLYETKAVLYVCEADCDEPGKPPQLREVKRHDIQVNKPLEYEGLLAYQFSFAQEPIVVAVTVQLKNKETGEVYGSFRLETNDPQSVYNVGPYTLQLRNYFPDFGLDDNGQPTTKTKKPNAPAYIFLIKGPDLPEEGSLYMYFPREIDRVVYRQDDINRTFETKLELVVDSMDDVEISEFTSSLNIRMDKALPYIWVGSAIGMIGLVMGFYWQHRRIWLRIDGNRLALGAHTNKNWFGLRKEVEAALHEMGMPVDLKPKEAGGGSS